MSVETNKALVRRFIEEVGNRGNSAVADELFARDFEVRDAVIPVPPGPEGVKQLFAAIHTAFPDLRETIEDLLAEDDRVMARWTVRGTHQGALLGVAPTGKTVTWRGFFVLRVAGGKFVELWQIHDQLGLLQQLGVTITPPSQAQG